MICHHTYCAYSLPTLISSKVRRLYEAYSPKCVEGEFCEVELPIYGVLSSSLPEAAIWRTEICHLPKCLERLSKNSLGGVSGIDVVGPPQRMDRTPMSPTQPTQGRLTRLEWLKSSSEPPEQCWQPLKRRYNRRRFLYIPILLHLLLLGPRFLFESWKEKTCISHLEFVLLSSKRFLHLQDLLLLSDH